MGSFYQVVCWVICVLEDGGEVELKKFIDVNSYWVVLDVVDVFMFLVDYQVMLCVVEVNWLKIKFYVMCEYVGFVFYKGV